MKPQFISSAEVKNFYSQFEELKKKVLGKTAEEVYSIDRRNSQQSRLFMIDIIPDIYRLYYQWPSDKSLKVLDVGIECGAGTGLLAELHNPRSNNHLKMSVTGLDINDDFKNYIKLCYPMVDFIKGDIFDFSNKNKWDLIICSHVIEHLKDPFSFVDKLRALTSKYVIVACPYNEIDLRRGHYQTIDDAMIDRLSPIEKRIYTNFCWRSRGDCVVMVFSSQ